MQKYHYSLSSHIFADNGSDWQQTDVEDHRGNRSQSRGSAETSQSGQSQEHGQGNSGNPTLTSAGHELSPIYIINDMVLKQITQV